MTRFWSPVPLAVYAAAGLAYHLLFHGPVDWSDAFTYVSMAFWPLLLAWQALKALAVAAVVLLAGLGLYWIFKDLAQRFRRPPDADPGRRRPTDPPTRTRTPDA